MALSMLLFGCQEPPTIPKYPGHQNRNSHCRELYDNGYKVNVPKCEHDTEHPKYKIGQMVKIKTGYDTRCRAVIVSNWQWTTRGDQSVYYVKVYCNGLPFTADPEFLESELCR